MVSSFKYIDRAPSWFYLDIHAILDNYLLETGFLNRLSFLQIYFR